MIGFNALGYLGRLGNQMFQYAALKGIARSRNYNYCIPPALAEKDWDSVEEYYQAMNSGGVGHLLLQPFTMKNNSQLNFQYIDKGRTVIQESGFDFDKSLLEECPDWVDLRGFFQSEKWFIHIEDEIREDFTFKDEILEPCKDMIGDISNPVSLHIRRKDYLTNSNHCTVGLNYYASALELVGKNSNVLVFSDEPDWCKEQELFKDDRFMIAEGNSGYVDMCLMSLCSDHIIANSSFSWWGAWLAHPQKEDIKGISHMDGQVIAPSDWFPDGKEVKDLYCKNWTVI